jgi:hypothetical protein
MVRGSFAHAAYGPAKQGLRAAQGRTAGLGGFRAFPDIGRAGRDASPVIALSQVLPKSGVALMVCCPYELRLPGEAAVKRFTQSIPVFRPNQDILWAMMQTLFFV